MKRPRIIKDVAASVHQRLYNRAREQGEDFDLTLFRYAVERFLYRLSRSSHADEFVLKGVHLFSLWTGSPHRTTRDLDVLGKGSPDIPHLEAVFQAIKAIQAFLLPPILALVRGQPFDQTWLAGGPWKLREDTA